MLSAFVDESKEQEVKNYISGTTVFPIVYSDDAVRWKKSGFFRNGNITVWRLRTRDSFSIHFI